MININPNAKLANVIVLAAALVGCESAGSPVEPELGVVASAPDAGLSMIDLGGGLTVVSSTVEGLTDIAATFTSSVPVGDQVAPGDSLSEVVTDLLGLSLNVAPRFSTSAQSNPGTVQDGEAVTVSGTSRVQTSKVTYSNGTSEWDQEIMTSNFTIRGRNSGGECKSQDQARFRGKSGPGASVFQQRARSAVVCPGDGRVYFVHLNIQTTVTPSGKVNSHVKDTCVSRSEEYPCATAP